MELTDLRLVQERIDQIIGQVGSKEFLNLLQIFVPGKEYSVEDKKRIYMFITHCVSMYYKISNDNLLGHEEVNGRKTSKFNDERQVCYFLIKKHLKFTIQEIADVFEREKKRVHEGLKKMDYHMGNKKMSDKKLVEDITIIDNQILEFKAILLNGKTAKAKKV